MEHGRRLSRARGALSERNLQGQLVSHLPNVRYLSGFTGTAGVLFLTADGARLITDSRYEEQAAEETAPGVDAEIRGHGRVAAVAGAVEGLGESPRVGYEAEHLTVKDRADLGDEAPEAEWVGTTGLVERWRERKEEPEVRLIERGAEIGDQVLAEFLGEVDEGDRERDLAAELDYRLRMAGSEGTPFETIVASGPRTALPHARPSGRPVREGDLLLVDFGVRVDGYCSDMTRTVVLGSAGEWQRRIHAAVRRAQYAALEAVAPGRPVSAVDRAARGSLEEAELGDRFGHSTGHGIGLEVHEDPSVSRRSDAELAPGHVITVEPGVYIPGRGGVRIEDDVAVEEEGSRRLTRFSRRLREL